MKHLTFSIAAGLLVAAGAAQADDPNSLQARKLGVIKGTAPGITLIDGPRPAATAAAPTAPAASAASGAAGTWGAPISAAAQPAAAKPAREPLTFELKPPSGVPVNSIKRMEGPGVGIPLPTSDGAPADKQRKSDGR